MCRSWLTCLQPHKAGLLLGMLLAWRPAQAEPQAMTPPCKQP